MRGEDEAEELESLSDEVGSRVKVGQRAGRVGGGATCCARG